MNYLHSPRSSVRGFTFIEALVTIAILSVMSALLVSAFSNAAADTNRIVAHQQQVAVQQAVNAWVGGESNRVDVIDPDKGSGKIRTIEEIRTDYNQVLTTSARFEKVSKYLDDVTFKQMNESSPGTDKIKSNALNSTKQHLELPTWEFDKYPLVNLVND